MSGVDCRLLFQLVIVNWLLCVGRCGLIVVRWPCGSVAMGRTLWINGCGPVCCVSRLLRIGRCRVAVFRLLWVGCCESVAVDRSLSVGYCESVSVGQSLSVGCCGQSLWLLALCRLLR